MNVCEMDKSINIQGSRLNCKAVYLKNHGNSLNNSNYVVFLHYIVLFSDPKYWSVDGRGYVSFRDVSLPENLLPENKAKVLDLTAKLTPASYTNTHTQKEIPKQSA